jgi:hypothetical protein
MGTVAQGQFPGPVTVTQVTCHAQVRDGRFLIPPAMVSALPPSTSGELAIGAETNQVRFTASGLDLGFASYYEEISRTVEYR